MKNSKRVLVIMIIVALLVVAAVPFVVGTHGGQHCWRWSSGSSRWDTTPQSETECSDSGFATSWRDNRPSEPHTPTRAELRVRYRIAQAADTAGRHTEALELFEAIQGDIQGRDEFSDELGTVNEAIRGVRGRVESTPSDDSDSGPGSPDFGTGAGDVYPHMHGDTPSADYSDVTDEQRRQDFADCDSRYRSVGGCHADSQGRPVIGTAEYGEPFEHYYGDRDLTRREIQNLLDDCNNQYREAGCHYDSEDGVVVGEGDDDRLPAAAPGEEPTDEGLSDEDLSAPSSRGTITVRRRDARVIRDGTFGDIGDTTYEFRHGCWRLEGECVDAETNTRINREFVDPDSEGRFTNALGDTIPMDDRVTTTERDIQAPSNGMSVPGSVDRTNRIVYEDGNWHIYDDEGNRIGLGDGRTQDTFNQQMNDHYGRNQEDYRQTLAYDTNTHETRSATPAECAQAPATLMCCPTEEACNTLGADYERRVDQQRMQNIWEGKTVIRSYIAILSAFGMDDEWDREAFEDLHDWAETTAGLAATGKWAESICRYTPDFDSPTGMVQYPGSGQFGMWIEGARTVIHKVNESDPEREKWTKKVYKITGSVMPRGLTKNSGKTDDEGKSTCTDDIKFRILLDGEVVDLFGELGTEDDFIRKNCDSNPFEFYGQAALYYFDTKTFSQVCIQFENTPLKAAIDEQLQDGRLCAQIVGAGGPGDVGCPVNFLGEPDCSALPTLTQEEADELHETESGEHIPPPRLPSEPI